MPDAFRLILQLAGGVFILYLAWGAFRAWRRYDTLSPPPPDAGQQSLRRAALMNALSPGPWVFWSLVTGPLLIQGWRESAAAGVGFLVGFYGAMISCLAVIIIAFGAARQLGPRVNRAMIGLSALALAGFGAYQITRVLPLVP